MSNKSESKIKIKSNETKLKISLSDFLLEKWNKEYQSKVTKNSNLCIIFAGEFSHVFALEDTNNSH